MKTEILLVEDDPIILLDLAQTLESKGYSIFGKCHSAQDAEVLLAQSTTLPDAAIFDIHLSGTKTGIDLANHVSNLYRFPFLFLTSYTDAATFEKAFAANPSAYLIKPFEAEDVFINLELALYKSRLQRKPDMHTGEEVFYVRTNQKLIKLTLQEILVVQAIDNYSMIYTPTEKHMLSRTLKSITEKLEPMGLVRVHKSYLINPDYIRYFYEDIIYVQEHKIPLGRSFRTEILDRLNIL